MNCTSAILSIIISLKHIVGIKSFQLKYETTSTREESFNKSRKSVEKTIFNLSVPTAKKLLCTTTIRFSMSRDSHEFLHIAYVIPSKNLFLTKHTKNITFHFYEDEN